MEVFFEIDRSLAKKVEFPPMNASEDIKMYLKGASPANWLSSFVTNMCDTHIVCSLRMYSIFPTLSAKVCPHLISHCLPACVCELKSISQKRTADESVALFCIGLHFLPACRRSMNGWGRMEEIVARVVI